MILLTTKKLLETNGNQSLPIVSNFAWANSAIGVFILPSALQLNSIPNVGKKIMQMQMGSIQTCDFGNLSIT